MKQQLERTTPSAVGISSRAINRFLDYAEGCGTEMHGVMILRHGKVAAEGWWAPYQKAYRHNSWSLTKSYVATAVGAACDRGLLTLEDKAGDWFKECLPMHPQPEMSKLTVRNLLCMSCGMEPNRVNWEPDWIKRFFTTPILHEPGSVFFYNNEASSLLAVLVERAAGKDFLTFLMETVLSKIGLGEDDVTCIRMKDGNLFGAAGLFSTTEANARLGQLYLQKGRWNGEQILSEDWVRQATVRQINISFPKMEEMKQPDKKLRVEHAQAGYGYQMWMCAYPEAYRFDGAMGQYVVVLPTLDMVVAISESSTAAADGPICMLNAVFDYLVSGVDTGEVGDPEADRCLADRLRGLVLPCPKGLFHSPQQKTANEKRFVFAPDSHIALVPDIFEHIIGTPAYLERVSLRFTEKECDLTYTDAAGMHLLRAGTDGEDRNNVVKLNLPIDGIAAARGVWKNEDCFALSICYPETCFSLILEFDFAAGLLTRVENLTFDGSPVQPRTAVLLPAD